jgi:hypothetical protein
MQCHKCLQFGHTAPRCNRIARCSHCDRTDHTSKHCACTNTPDPCTNLSDCRHSLTCAVCTGNHSAYDENCPTRKKELQRLENEHLDSGRFYNRSQ